MLTADTTGNSVAVYEVFSIVHAKTIGIDLPCQVPDETAQKRMAEGFLTYSGGIVPEIRLRLLPKFSSLSSIWYMQSARYARPWQGGYPGKLLITSRAYVAGPDMHIKVKGNTPNMVAIANDEV